MKRPKPSEGVQDLGRALVRAADPDQGPDLVLALEVVEKGVDLNLEVAVAPIHPRIALAREAGGQGGPGPGRATKTMAMVRMDVAILDLLDLDLDLDHETGLDQEVPRMMMTK